MSLSLNSIGVGGITLYRQNLATVNTMKWGYIALVIRGKLMDDRLIKKGREFNGVSDASILHLLENSLNYSRKLIGPDYVVCTCVGKGADITLL